MAAVTPLPVRWRGFQPEPLARRLTYPERECYVPVWRVLARGGAGGASIREVADACDKSHSWARDVLAQMVAKRYAWSRRAVERRGSPVMFYTLVWDESEAV